MEYPIVLNLGEYEGYLPKKQSCNIKEISAFYKVRKNLTVQEKNDKLAKFLQQPIMVNAYRTAGVAPNNILDYVESVLKMSEAKKDGMIVDLYTVYGLAGQNVDYGKQIERQAEWDMLDTLIKKYLTISMQRFAEGQNKGYIQPCQETKFGKKIINLFKKCIS